MIDEAINSVPTIELQLGRMLKNGTSLFCYPEKGKYSYIKVTADEVNGITQCVFTYWEGPFITFERAYSEDAAGFEEMVRTVLVKMGVRGQLREWQTETLPKGKYSLEPLAVDDYARTAHMR
jgi:hypothetical protein